MKRSPAVDRSATIKANIRSAAAHLFAENGFAGTGIREIADEAGVDKSIVIRHFGSKETLFIETVALPAEWIGTMEGPLEELPARLVRLLAGGGDGTGRGVFAALLRASDSEDVREQLRHGLEAQIAAPLASRLPGPDAEVRAHLAAAALVGLLTTLWVVEDEVVTSLTPRAVGEFYAPALHALLRV